MILQNKQRQHLLTFVIILGLLALTALGYLAYKELTKQPTPVTPIASGAGSDNADVAQEASDEVPVAAAAVTTYQVAADAPRMLTINSLSINARIKPMAINSIGAVAAPVNIYDSGWYTGSSKPGEAGAAFIDGHASGATRQGLFAYLDTLKSGDAVSIERGDGEVLNYKVVYVETVHKDEVDMRKALRTYGDAKEGLNLMTCTGTWLKDQRTYDMRAIVYTERVYS